MADLNKKLKLLLFGSVQDKILPFANKVKSLHKSKAGPFDLCFCIGSFHVPSDESSAEYQVLKSLPIPVYLQDALTTLATESSDEIQTLIAPHLKAFPTTKSNIYNLSVDCHPHVNLVVASCPRSLRLDDEASVRPLMEKLKHVSYVGCDFLLTTHWPQGMETLDASMQQQAQLCATYDVAEVALRARARYHVVAAHASLNLYWQSPPFFHLKATTSTQTPQHTGRVIAMASLSADKKVPKQHKSVHALGVVPLHFMDQTELLASLGQGAVAPCPFTDDSYQMDPSASAASTVTGGAGRLSEAQARRLVAEAAGSSAANRWNLKPKNHKRALQDDDEEEVDPNNKTLFVHGLHRDVSGQLQDAANSLLLEAFRPYGVVQVRRPPNARTTAFAFLEFETHQAARLCLETLGGETAVAGVTLEVKWGKSSGNHAADGHHKRPRLTEADARESSTLYFRLPKTITAERFATVTERVRQWMEHTLEDALNEGGGETRITAAEEPALQVELQWTEGNSFGFLKFASHAAASMALATLTGSTDGGIVANPNKETAEEAGDEKKSDDDKVTKKETAEGDANLETDGTIHKEGEPVEDVATKEGDAAIKVEEKKDIDQSEKRIWGLAMHWAMGTVEKSDKNTMIQDADCDFQFQRQHFPADSRQDCWFCLASEGCEKHLITGVYQQCYAAMPKGAIHRGHVLLIPVSHTSRGVFLERTVSREIQELQKALRKHAREQYDCDLFVFERAIQTRGGYHTHIQCVPVPKGLGIKLETTLRSQAKVNKMDFREIQSPDLDLSTLLSSEDDEDGGYFYAEVPLPGETLEFKRFLYKVQSQQQEDGWRTLVPLQFGREVIAAVLGKSEFAHWKACQVSKEEETKMAMEQRQSFEKYCSVDNC